MNQEEQAQALGIALDKLIENFTAEFDLTYTSIVGVLTMKAHALCSEVEIILAEEEEEERGY